MIQTNSHEYWSEIIKGHFHTPSNIFEQNAEEIVSYLLEISENNATLSLRRLLFYMNSNDCESDNNEQLEKAKKRLEELIEEKHETLKN